MNINRYQNPNYTGRNRCMICSALNIIIASFVSGLLFLKSPVLAIGFLGVSAAAIYFRGYLIPGTPTITKQYFPNRLLAILGKHKQHSLAVDVDPEKILFEADVIESTSGQDDLGLNPRIAQKFQREAPETGGIPVEGLRSVLGQGNYEIEIDEDGDSAAAFINGSKFGQWPSRIAAISDVAAGKILSDELPRWTEYSVHERSVLLKAVRSAVGQCPDCQGQVILGEEERESCCTTRQVVTIRCLDCKGRLLELQSRNLVD